MITITLNNIRNLNTSLQVGDLIYATPLAPLQAGSDDFEANTLELGTNRLVGILRRITVTGNVVDLDVDNLSTGYMPKQDDFVMFSKYSQMDGDVIGYYAQATFVNNSRQPAELFSIGSEITINSK
jgi:hypothetical protein